MAPWTPRHAIILSQIFNMLVKLKLPRADRELSWTHAPHGGPQLTTLRHPTHGSFQVRPNKSNSHRVVHELLKTRVSTSVPDQPHSSTSPLVHPRKGLSNPAHPEPIMCSLEPCPYISPQQTSLRWLALGSYRGRPIKPNSPRVGHELPRTWFPTDLT